MGEHLIRYDKSIIKVARIKSGKSMLEIAKSLNTTRQRYSKLEENPGAFNLDCVVELLNLLQIDKNDFFLI